MVVLERKIVLFQYFRLVLVCFQHLSIVGDRGVKIENIDHETTTSQPQNKRMAQEEGNCKPFNQNNNKKSTAWHKLQLNYQPPPLPTITISIHSIGNISYSKKLYTQTLHCQYWLLNENTEKKEDKECQTNALVSLLLLIVVVG